jgi:eukaryotic-like serine/threonine-protein kinase
VVIALGSESVTEMLVGPGEDPIPTEEKLIMKKVAVVGAVVAGGAAAAMAIVAGTASAVVPGDCTGTVTLLAERGIQPGVVAECESDPRVQVDETHDGLRQPTDLPERAARESEPARPGSGGASMTEPGGSPDGTSRERYGADADSDNRRGDNGGRASESAASGSAASGSAASGSTASDSADDTAGGSDSDADAGDSTESPERGGVG